MFIDRLTATLTHLHHATAARNEGVAVCFQHFSEVEVLLDDGCLGL
ncbi:hypothetical protein [Streptomyces narbonensis]